MCVCVVYTRLLCRDSGDKKGGEGRSFDRDRLFGLSDRPCRFTVPSGARTMRQKHTINRNSSLVLRETPFFILFLRDTSFVYNYFYYFIDVIIIIGILSNLFSPQTIILADRPDSVTSYLIRGGRCRVEGRRRREIRTRKSG